jgi:hypothetical protein
MPAPAASSHVSAPVVASVFPPTPDAVVVVLALVVVVNSDVALVVDVVEPVLEPSDPV